MPQAIPAMVSTVRRRSWRMAEYACCKRSRCMLFLAEGLHGFEHGGAARRIEACGYASNSQRNDCQSRCRSDQLRRIESSAQIDAREQGHQPGSSTDTDASAEQRQKRAFHEKLEHNAGIGSADGLAQS